MYLSRVEINPRRRDTIKALSSPEVIHAAVMSSFPTIGREGGDRILWRIDELGPSTYILVQSSSKPDFTHIIEQFGWPDSEQQGETQDYTDFLFNIREGDIRNFKLRANPTRSIMEEKSSGKRGKVRQHITAEQQLKWLFEKSEKCGFTLDSSETGAQIVKREDLRFKNKNNNISITAVSYEGTLKVNNTDEFIQSVKNGIGRAKAYGCGMLIVSRAIE